MKLFYLVAGLSVLLLLPFLIWGEFFEATFGGDRAVEWLQGWGSWAWLVAIVLLVSDVVLPVPATGVMAALGLIYGTLLGGLIGAVGSFLAGLIAYLACRWWGRGAALRLAGAEDLAQGERVFGQVGGWLVALSRCLPLLPEVVTCLAGLTRMSPRVFTLALASGSLPMALVFAAVGDLGSDSPGLSLALSIGIPLVVWPVARFWFVRKRAQVDGES